MKTAITGYPRGGLARIKIHTLTLSIRLTGAGLSPRSARAFMTSVRRGLRVLLKLSERFLRYCKKPKEKLWVNPDCGLKTRRNAETVPSLEDLVAGVQEVGRSLPL